jgi:integrase
MTVSMSTLSVMVRANAARSRGSIRQRGGSLQVRLFSGRDPVTGKDIYLTASIKGTDKAAQRKAKDKLAEFRAQVINQRSASTSVTLSYALDEWLRVTEIEDSTRKTYVATSSAPSNPPSATSR